MKRIKASVVCVVVAAVCGVAHAKPVPKAMAYTSVCIGGDVVSEGLPLVKAIQSGNWRQVEAILDRGTIKIDDVICIHKSGPSDGYAEFFATALERQHMQMGASSTDTTVTVVPIDNLTFSSRQYRRDFGGAQIEAANRTFNPTGNPLKNMFVPQVGNMDFTSIAYVSGTGVQRSWLELYGTPLMVAARLGNKFMVKKLLSRGANPNVFIRTGGVLHRRGSLFGAKENLIGCTRPWICALLDAYSMSDEKSVQDMSACASMLIDAGAYFPRSTKDDLGRTMLWDAAILTSPELMEVCVKRFGFDVNEEDNLGRTVAEYLVQAGSGGGKYANAISAVLRKLRELGANVPGISVTPREMDESPMPARGGIGLPSEMPSDASYLPPTGGRATGAVVNTVRREDHSAEIAALQHRVLALRMELEDARSNRKIATAQGTGWVTASMHEQQIMREISDCERQIMELRNR